MQGNGGGGHRAVVASGIAAVGAIGATLIVLSSSAGSVDPKVPLRTKTSPTPTLSPTYLGKPERPHVPRDLSAAFNVMVVFAIILAVLLIAVIAWLATRKPATDELALGGTVAPIDAIRAAVDEGIDLVAAGGADDAIIACWLAFERSAADVGAERRQFETPSEFTVRVLSAVQLPEEHLTGLAELYREARFSTHVLPETAGDEALAALRAIRSVLGSITTDVARP